MAQTHSEDSWESDYNYRHIFEESPASMYIFDLETLEFLAVNHAASVQYGYTPEEFRALKVTDIRPQEEVPALQQVLDDIPGVPYFDYGRWKHKRKNGEVFFVHIYAHGTLFRQRKARFVMAIDIDKRVEAETALLQKSSEIVDILESVTDGFYAINAQWEVTYINKEAERILNCEREHVVGKKLWSIFPKATGTRFYDEYTRAMSSRASTNFEEFYAPLHIWTSVRVYPTREGLAVYFADITEHKKIREKIAKDEQHLRAVINNTANPIWSIDRDNTIISANEAFYRRMDRLAGKRISQLSPADFDRSDFNQWQVYYRRAFAGESFKMIWKEQSAEENIFEEVSFTPIRDESGHIYGVSCLSRDITDEYVYTRQIEQQNEQLRKISWIQSHEIRAPLSGILGLVDLLEQEPGGETTAELITMLKDAAQQLDLVVHKISAESKPIDKPPGPGYSY